MFVLKTREATKSIVNIRFRLRATVDRAIIRALVEVGSSAGVRLAERHQPSKTESRAGTMPALFLESGQIRRTRDGRESSKTQGLTIMLE